MMADFNAYGLPQITISGQGIVKFTDGSNATVRFELRQMEDGLIAVECFSSDAALFDIDYLEGVSDEGLLVRTGSDNIRTYFSSSSNSTDFTNQFHFLTNRVECIDESVVDGSSVNARFALLNFIFGPPHKRTPFFVEFSVGNYNIHITTVTDYTQRFERLRKGGGVLHTAWCDVTTSDSNIFNIMEVEIIVSDLLTASSLVAGTRSTWLFYELRNVSDNVIQKTYDAKITRGFSNASIALGWWTNFVPLAIHLNRSYVSEPTKKQEIRERIEHYIDASTDNIYLETRTLSAATLLDILANHHANETRTEYIVFRSIGEKVRSALRKFLADNAASFPIATALELDQLKENLTGINRTSFRRRLTLLLASLSISSDEANIKNVVDTRNKIVHEGRFYSPTREDWNAEYYHLLWTGRVILLKMLGYTYQLSLDSTYIDPAALRDARMDPVPPSL